MSSFRNPVGNEPPGVYWRRRILVFGGLLVVIVVIVMIVVGRGGGASQAAATASSTPGRAASAVSSLRAESKAAQSAYASGAASASAAPASSAATKAASGAKAAGGAKDGAACLKSQIALKPVTDKSTYGPTEQPKISMSITNSGSNSCHMDLGSSQQVLTITSGAETYWTSKDCQTGGTNQDVTLKAGQTLTTPAIAWDRTRSSTTTCDSTRSSVPAGGASYHLKVAVGNISSAASAQFVLN